MTSVAHEAETKTTHPRAAVIRQQHALVAVAAVVAVVGDADVEWV